jgi:hypothetical protein
VPSTVCEKTLHTLVLIGTEIDKRSGAPMALLARQDEEGLRYVGGAFSPSRLLTGTPYASMWPD